MHSIQLEKKLRLPDPVKALEGVWKVVRRTRQQVNMIPGRSATVSSPNWEAVAVKKRARIEADRQKARGISYALRTTVR